MGAVFSCLANLCSMIGQAIMMVIDAIFGVIIFIVQAIMGLLDIISGDWGDRLEPWKYGKSGRPYDYGAWQYGTQRGGGNRGNRPASDFTPWRGLVMTG